ncbi:hypothetical protein AB1E18_010450 [Capra hircus]
MLQLLKPVCLEPPERASRLSRREEKLPCPLLWQNPRCVASWPNVCDFILLEHSWSPWGLQLSISLLVQSDLEYKESLWVEFLGSLSLCCAPEL